MRMIFLFGFLVACSTPYVEPSTDGYLESFCVGHTRFITDVEACVNARNPIQPTPHNNEEHQAVGGVDYGFQGALDECYDRVARQEVPMSVLVAELSEKEKLLRAEHDCPKDWLQTRVP